MARVPKQLIIGLNLLGSTEPSLILRGPAISPPPSLLAAGAGWEGVRRYDECTQAQPPVIERLPDHWSLTRCQVGIHHHGAADDTYFL